MKSHASSPKEYIQELPLERGIAIELLTGVIKKHLPEGFVETMGYGMIAYVVPHERYPAGYHCDPSLPLPFINVASQKNFVALYHMGLYADEKTLAWFQKEYPKYSKYKLNMGKSCVRFKRMDDIPYQLIGMLCSKISVEDWIKMYEKIK